MSAPNQIVLHCCVKFQMTSKDVWEEESRAGSMTVEVKRRTRGCTENHRGILDTKLLPPVVAAVTAVVSSSLTFVEMDACMK